MLQSDFFDYLAKKGVLSETQANSGGPDPRRPEANAESDRISLTKLTQTAFTAELAAFYASSRVQHAQLIGDPFVGTDLSPRFIREERLFPYEDGQGGLTLAVSKPIKDEIVRAVEVALGGDGTGDLASIAPHAKHSMSIG